MKAHHFIAIFALLVLGYSLMQYSSNKNVFSDGFGDSNNQQQQGNNGGIKMMPNSDVNLYGREHNGISYATQQGYPAAAPAGQNEVFSSVSGINTSSIGLPPSCTPGTSISDPADLLPKDTNSQWAQLNPAGQGSLKNVNLLKAGYHTGIDTIGSTLRNANLQVRSEPPNPTTNVSPWMNSTIEPDLMRAPLEIGCGPQ